MYLASQIIATLSMIVSICGRLFAKQSNNLLFNSVANFLSLTSYLLLGALLGCIGNTVALARSLIFALFLIKGWDKKLWLLILFLSLTVGTTIATAYISNEIIWYEIILVSIKYGSYTYGAWQHNVNIFRIFAIVSCITGVTYALLHAGYMNAMSEFVSFLCITFVIIKEAVKAKKQSKEVVNIESENEEQKV